jgi:hypothetical protein
MSVFQQALRQRPEPKRGMLGGLFGGAHPQGFATEIGNRLLALPKGQTLTSADVASVRAKFNLKNAGQGRAEALGLLGKVIGKLNASDIQQQAGDTIRSIARVMDLPQTKVDALLAEAGERAFREAVGLAISDDDLTEGEHNDLSNLANAAGLKDDEASAILTAAVGKKLEEEVLTALGDGELSPQEEVAINHLAARLRTKLSFSDQTERVMAEARRLWQINHGPLVPVDSPLLLKKGEVAYSVSEGRAMETRSRTTGYRSAGPSFRVRIMKGVSYRVGSASVSRTTEEYSHSFGQGTVVLTDRRLLFRAAEKTINITYPKVVDFELFSDGVKIYKDTGKPLTVALDRKDQAFGLLFARLVSA